MTPRPGSLRGSRSAALRATHLSGWGAILRSSCAGTAQSFYTCSTRRGRMIPTGWSGASPRLMYARPHLQPPLLLAGKDPWCARRVHDAAKHSGVSDRIRFLGFVSDEDLLNLYNACDLFCFPSFYEGFGLPVLEAMASAAPV